MNLCRWKTSLIAPTQLGYAWLQGWNLHSDPRSLRYMGMSQNWEPLNHPKSNWRIALICFDHHFSGSARFGCFGGTDSNNLGLHVWHASSHSNRGLEIQWPLGMKPKGFNNSEQPLREFLLLLYFIFYFFKRIRTDISCTLQAIA